MKTEVLSDTEVLSHFSALGVTQQELEAGMELMVKEVPSALAPEAGPERSERQKRVVIRNS